MGLLAGGTVFLGSALADIQFQGDGVQDTAALTAILPENRFDKQEVTVEGPPLEQYFFNLQSVAGASAPNVLVPDDSPAAGRWIRHIPSGGLPGAHALGGAEHTADTFANLESKISDASLIKVLDPGTDNITAAITALAAGGGELKLAEGTFTVDGADIVPDKSNVVINGSGPATIIDITGTTATKGFDIGAFDNITIKNLTIRLNDSSGGLRGIVFASGQTGHKVENVIFENLLGANTAFIDVNTSNSDIDHCVGSVTAGTIATAMVSATGPSGLKVSHCRFDGAETGISLFHDEAEISHCHITDFKTGFAIKLAGDRCKINGGNITFTAGAVGNTAIELAATALNTTIDDVTINATGNTSTNSIGINVLAGADKCSISSCRMVTMPGKGIQAAASRCTVDACIVQGSSSGGIAISMNGLGSIVNDCHVDDFDTCLALVTAGGVEVSGCHFVLRNQSGARGIIVSAPDCSITGCHINGNGASAANVVGIEAAIGGDNLSITGGSIRNFAANGIAVEVTGTHTDCSVKSVQIETVRKGVVVATGGTRASILGCKFRTLGSNAIELNSVVDCIVSSGNRFEAITGTEILETGSANNNQIHGNYVNGGTITTVGATTEVSDNFPEVRVVLEGSQDLTAGTPVNLNITGANRIKRIKRARFWISVNGADVGANTTTKIQLKIFTTDGFTHAELDTNGAAELAEDFGEFQFDSQDVKVAADNGDGTIDIDATANFGIDDLVRIHDGTNFEYQRVLVDTDGDTLDLYDTILKSGVGAWSVDDDVTRVFELIDLGYKDADDTDEIHLQMIPRSGDSDCRLHFWIEYEGGI